MSVQGCFKEEDIISSMVYTYNDHVGWCLHAKYKSNMQVCSSRSAKIGLTTWDLQCDPLKKTVYLLRTKKISTFNFFTLFTTDIDYLLASDFLSKKCYRPWKKKIVKFTSKSRVVIFTGKQIATFGLFGWWWCLKDL